MGETDPQAAGHGRVRRQAFRPHGLIRLSKLQVTPPLPGSPVTVAVNCWFPPLGTETPLFEFGEIETVMPGTEAVALPAAAVSVMDVAVIVTGIIPAGGAVGAV